MGIRKIWVAWLQLKVSLNLLAKLRKHLCITTLKLPSKSIILISPPSRGRIRRRRIWSRFLMRSLRNPWIKLQWCQSCRIEMWVSSREPSTLVQAVALGITSRFLRKQMVKMRQYWSVEAAELVPSYWCQPISSASIPKKNSDFFNRTCSMSFAFWPHSGISRPRT
jgi:hypothetical protein